MPRAGADETVDAPSAASLLLLSLSSRTCLCRSLLSLSLFLLLLLLFFAMLTLKLLLQLQMMKTMETLPCHAYKGSFENDLSGKDEREMGKHVVKAI